MEKKYALTLSANCVGEDGNEMFDSTVTYKNMEYEDVALVEDALIKMMAGLNDYAKNRPGKKK